MITVTVNGKKRQLNGPTALTDFLSALKVRRKFVAVGWEVEEKTATSTALGPFPR